MFARSLAPVLVAALLAPALALPAAAEPTVTTISGDDQHLYINVSREQVTRVNTDLKAGKIGVFSGEESETFLTKGKIRIGTSRFYELLEQKGAAPEFMKRIHAKRADTAFWGYLTLCAIGVGLGGFSLSNLYYGQRFSGYYAMAGAGALAAGGVTGLVWWAKLLSPDFTWEQANDAVVDYNKRLDAAPAR